LEGAHGQERGDQQAEDEDDDQRHDCGHPALVESVCPRGHHHAPLLGSQPGFRMRAVSVILTKTSPCWYVAGCLPPGWVAIRTFCWDSTWFAPTRKLRWPATRNDTSPVSTSPTLAIATSNSGSVKPR